jgi:subtilisin family serine protease/subtilisin-like proprotein convertase family protein
MHWRRFLAGAVMAVFLCFTETALCQTNPVARFHFKEPHLRAYRIELPRGVRVASLQQTGWVKAVPEIGPGAEVELGSRLVLQLEAPDALAALLQARPLQLARELTATTFILQAPDPWTAIRQAELLASQPGVKACYPVMRRQRQLAGAYAPKPSDTYFPNQWYLENRGSNGPLQGVDLNVRAAWPATRGAGVTIAIVDDGVDLTHPDLIERAQGRPHHNFIDDSTNALPISDFDRHGTAVAGLAVATGGNARGMSGVAPEAGLASWKVFQGASFLLSDEQVMDMFQNQSNSVAVQNHSWIGASTGRQEAPSLTEQIGLSNAFFNGRSGRGVAMARAAGNGRVSGHNVNDDGYVNDPNIVAVAAVRSDGRASRYSNPGAAVLVGAPSSEVTIDGFLDSTFPTLFTTDRQGNKGYNQISFTNDLADYGFDSLGFSGTSGSSPQIAGGMALMLGANPLLAIRDVQQILALASRHIDMADPDLTTNGAGLLVSHNVGFGVPNLGQAVQLALNWPNRPPATNVLYTNSVVQSIPDAGLRVAVAGVSLPPELALIPAYASRGPVSGDTTPTYPLTYVGLADTTITTNLTNRAALILRGGGINFIDKIIRAAQAGASLAIVFNNFGDDLVTMGNTDFAPIPAVFIGNTAGDALREFTVTNGNPVTAGFDLQKRVINFAVAETLLCEHITLKVNTDHPRRGDLRITLVSPSGTRSIMQNFNGDGFAGPTNWTYYSTHHFFETSYGTWKVEFYDQAAGATGSVLDIILGIKGVLITDLDYDGLDDSWETSRFTTLANGPRDDPDQDGFNNAREQVMGTNPLDFDVPFQLDLSSWNLQLARLSWPSSSRFDYEVQTAGSALSLTNAAGFTVVTNLPGKFPETEVFIPYTNAAPQFFRVVRQPRP